MKSEIYIAGDPSVGIFSQYLSAELPFDEFDDKDHREEVRKQLGALYSEWATEPVGVRFEDECPDCGHVDCSPHCINQQGRVMGLNKKDTANRCRNQDWYDNRCPDCSSFAQCAEQGYKQLLRCRAALKQIARYGENGICPYGCDTPNIARDALSNQQEGE